MGWGFFEGFEEGVEGRGGEHVGFVQDVYFVAALWGGQVDLVGEEAYVVYAIVGGGVQFNQVEGSAFGEASARGALPAGVAVRCEPFAVDGFSQDAGTGGLAYASRPKKQIRRSQLAMSKGIAKGLYDKGLTHHLGKGARPILASRRLMPHPTKLRNRGASPTLAKCGVGGYW